MTAREMADMLNGGLYGNEMTYEEELLARESGLVVAFGYSDDNVEFRGAIYDEVSCYDGGVIRLTRAGVVAEPDCGHEDCKFYKAAIGAAATIEAVWYSTEINAARSFKTDIPHEKFNIYEDDELFCVGIVFRQEDLPA